MPDHAQRSSQYYNQMFYNIFKDYQKLFSLDRVQELLLKKEGESYQAPKVLLWNGIWDWTGITWACVTESLEIVEGGFTGTSTGSAWAGISFNGTSTGSMAHARLGQPLESESVPESEPKPKPESVPV